MPDDRKVSMAEIKAEIKKVEIAALIGLKGEEAKQEALTTLRQRGDIEDTRPEPRSAVPELVRGGVFPIKARLVKLQAFENDPAVIDEVLLKFRAALGDETLVYAGSLVNTINTETGALLAIGLAQQVNEWLLTAEEIDMLDYEMSVDPLTGFPRFLILYTE